MSGSPCSAHLLIHKNLLTVLVQIGTPIWTEHSTHDATLEHWGITRLDAPIQGHLCEVERDRVEGFVTFS